MLIKNRFVTAVSRVAIAALTLTLVSVTTGVTPAQAATTVYINDTDAPLAFVKANSTNLVGTGVNANDVVRYNNVGTYGGVTIEAVVTTLSVSGSVSNYDNPGSASTAAGAANNWMINTVGGEARFRFEFFRAGTYTGPNTGIPVVLQNVKITSIDLDCSSSTGSYQYTDATGFQKYAMMSPTNLAVQTVASTNRVRFIANKTGSRTSVPEDQVMLKYDAVQKIEFSFGNVVAAQTNYFGLVFGGWPNGGIPVEYTNIFNTPPVSESTTINTANGVPVILSTSNFGPYSDADNNPFMAVKIGTVTGGTLEWNNGSTWTTVTAGQSVTVADIEKGNLRFTASGASSIQFWVYDGLDFSTNPYTITGTNAANAQTITFANPGLKGVGSGSFASGATASSGLTVTLVSLTPGICTVSGLNIVPVAAGTCVIVAKQPGDSTYGAAPEVTQEFQIVAGTAPTETQTITFPQPADQSLDTATVASSASALSTGGTSLTPTLTSNTPSVCTVTGLTINIVGAGTCTITASQPGTSTIAPAANVVRSFNVTAVAGGGTVPIAHTWGASIPTGGSTLKLTGFVDYNGASTTYYFCWTENTPSSSAKELVGGNGKSRWCSTAQTPYTTSGQVLTSDITFGSDSTSQTKIKRGNTVYFQVVAYHSSSAKVFGEIMKISSSYGYVTTAAESNLLQDSATLNGTAKSLKDSTRYLNFCIRPDFVIYDKVRLFNDTDDKCPTLIKSNPASLSNKGSTSSANANAIKLEPATYYYYQLIISSGTTPSSSNASYGNIVRFKTAAANPVATTLGTTGYTTTSATLTGSILANDNVVTPKFCYSETPTATAGVLTESNCIGGLVIANPETISVGAGAINKIITGLTTGHTYYYQAVGVYNSTSKVYGAIKSFTLGAPTVTTLSATGVKLTSGSSWEALLNGYINPNSGTATNYFCIAETNTVTATGAMTECVTGGGVIALDSATATTLTSAAPITLSKTGLTASTTYYFQAIGRNLTQSPSLDQYGEVLSFVTAFAPSVTTSQVTLFGIDTATVPGIITANGALTTGSFCLSTSNASTDGVLNSCQFTFATTPSTTSGSNVSITADAIGLTQATTYYYQAIGDNSQGTSYGEILNFTTLAGAPIATTVAASSIANTTATINGRINPSGAATTVRFCWGTSSSLSGCTLTDTVTVVSASAGLTSASLNLSNLSAGQDYYFRIQGTNSQGSAQGSILSFKAGSPSVQTLPATEVTATTAVLNGTVKANAANTSAVKFCLSDASTLTNGELTCNQSSPLGSKNASQQVVLSSVTTGTQETVTVTGLTSGTTYYFQIQATAGSDTTYGDVLSFAAGAPIGITKSATSIASASAQLNGLVNRVNDSTASARFCLADAEEINADGSLATCLQSVDVPDAQLVTLTTDDQVYVDATGLAPGNTYFFQITTTGTGGSSIGQVFSFSTGFAVTFDANGGSGTMNDQAAMSTTALTLNAFSKAGYSFGGWSRTAGGAVAFADGANYDFTANITLYAIWNAVSTTPTPPPSTPLLKSKLTWANPAPISQGTPLSGTQLNANPEVPSTCVYTPALGTVLAAGTYTLSVVCTPLDSNYEPTSGTVTLVVKSKTKPKITWFNPTPITSPTPLTGTQLNAAANVPGKYTYNPAAGTVLAPGKHPLNVKFSPDDKETYEELEANVTITVLGENVKAEPTPSAPVSQPDVKTGQTPPSGIVLQTSGKVDFIKVVKTQQPLGVLITAPDWSLRLSSTTQFVSGTTQDTNDRVVIEKGNTVTTSGTGFKPFSQVDIWVYSTPTWLGAVITDAFGNFTTTVPMPKALPAGDHTFQAQGQTPESTVRKADVPITLVNPTVKGEPGSLKFEVYFGMNSPIVTNAEKKRIAKLVKLAQSKIASGAKVTVEVSGWVQPNPNPGNIKYLSTHRADNVANALRAIGLKAAYTKKYPGLAKDNIPTARHASVLIKWSKSK